MLTFPSIVKLTVTGLRISAVDTVAFLDNCADLIPYAGSGRRIRIKDAAGKYLDGVIGARGTGETLSENKITDGDFSVNPGPWSVGANWDLSTGVAVATSANTTVRQAVTSISAGTLVRAAGTAVVTSGTTYLYTSGTTTPGITTSGAKVQYTTLAGTSTLLGVNSSDFTGSWDDLYFYAVLAPSTSGLLIRNLAGAQSFQSQESGFAHNAASYAVEVFNVMRVV